MAAKVSIQDITDAGFRAAQFGTPADWDSAGSGYLARLIARAEVWARGRYGSGAYDSVAQDTPAHESLRAAEACFVAHHLWKRRAAFIDSNAASSHDNQVYLDRREFEAQAVRAWECAEANMAQAISGPTETPGQAVVLAHAVSGPFVGRAPCSR